MDDDKHYPPGAEPEPTPAEEQPKETPPEASKGAPKEEAPNGDTPKPGEEAPKEETPKDEPQDPPAEPAPIKKRSIYDDLKDTRKEKNEYKDTTAAALKALGVEVTGTETPEQLRALIEQHKPANSVPETPPEPSKPKDELEAFAEEHEMDAAGLNRLVEIIQKRIPSAQLTDDERKTLKDLQAFKANAEAADQRRQEDASIASEAPTVKKQLDIHDDKELEAVMNEVTRLAHTAEYHDKPIKYIVWDKQSELSKLVSPKKPSFETGGHVPPAEPETSKDFSTGKVTPQDAAAGMYEDRPRSTYEIRRPQS